MRPQINADQSAILGTPPEEPQGTLEPTVDWIDGHLDLAYLAGKGRDLLSLPDPAEGCISLPALRQSGIGLVFGTIFTSPGSSSPD